MNGPLRALVDHWHLMMYRLMAHGPIGLSSWLGSVIVGINMRINHRDAIDGARRNLAIHHPEADAATIEAGVRRYMDNIGRLYGEFAVLHRMVPEGRVEMIGFHPDSPEEAGQPILAIVLHLGNWEVIGAALEHVGRRVASFWDPPKTPMQRRIVEESRTQVGIRLLSPDLAGLRDALAELRAGGLVAIFGDEARSGKTMAPLFGRPPHLSGNLSIAARLARKTDARLVVAHCERLDGCRFRIRAGERFRLPETPGRTVLDDVAFLNAKIEPVITAHLDRWYYLDDSIAPIE
ncbi:hypothetical protein EYW49_06660 [Siculibacillus lacustris]|uniref:Lipid A biosynthesis lauroyl acyltransferase n=1 Tax=Siculibacillus lacustris TaxID=1549641 RepID=A0A4Q9VTV4_9HYPH|nr:lysophospholipid acyltransferase family protein [Siculibacillus lacustris]TBW39544.1 hypothetical protein EYW49_06660 [Siculibacillus lacustris]